MHAPGKTENPFAGQGPVLLDIGGDIGALVVAMPPETEGLEVEIRPAGSTAAATEHRADHRHGHAHDHHNGHAHGPTHHPHVAVVARPGANGPAHSLVYPEVSQGSYELVPIPGNTVVLTAQVEGGVVTHAAWPESLSGREAP
ncbi:hypothetical protein ABEG17_06075 [Pedococcus sp. KACC 23699]|uniref:Uncharacterized protein n=1 Tax=Pedococcus sp. KACC 23699 TaxID=3149228 RepID=A0AAU7JX86_9MICO